MQDLSELRAAVESSQHVVSQAEAELKRVQTDVAKKATGCRLLAKQTSNPALKSAQQKAAKAETAKSKAYKLYESTSQQVQACQARLTESERAWQQASASAWQHVSSYDAAQLQKAHQQLHKAQSESNSAEVAVRLASADADKLKHEMDGLQQGAQLQVLKDRLARAQQDVAAAQAKADATQVRLLRAVSGF